MSPDSDAASTAPRGDLFLTTRWSMVIAAGHASSPDSEHALADLCQAYWYPLYAYVRRQGHSREDAEDLTQAFFARFLEKNPFAGLAAEHGKFRAFLLASLKHFLANEWDKARRQKRGGGAIHLSLDWQDADKRYHLDPPDPSSPERAFDRAWALALLERVILRLRDECAAAGKAPLFDLLKGSLTAAEPTPYADAARRLGIDQGALRVAAHRLRKRYRLLLRDEIAHTLTDPDLVAEELRSLQAALAG